MTESRSTFTLEFRLEAAQLIVKRSYTINASEATMGVGKTTVCWVRQLKNEHNGITSNATLFTSDQRKFEKRIKRIEMEKEILTKANPLSMANTMNGLR